MEIKPLHLLLSLLLLLAITACSSTTERTNGEEETTTIEMEAANPPNYGLALYTLRDAMAEDPKGVLKQVAEIGYKNIEAAGYEDGKFYGMEPTEFKAYLEEIDITPLSSHHGDITLDNADQEIADAKAAGFKYLVLPIPPMGHFSYDEATQTLGMSDEVEEVMNIINTIAEKCAAAGIECLYHNHDFEFVEKANGIIPMDYFIENSNPDHLSFQLDLYWATKAGVNPVDYFKKAAGRIKAWHVKDMDDQGRFAPVGEGNIDFQTILAEAELSGMECYFVEQDATFNHTPMEAIKISFKGLQHIGFE